MISASGVAAARSADQQAGGGAIPTLALHNLVVRPIPMVVAKKVLVKEHYLHSLPGGTRLTFGTFVGNNLLGTVTLGAGPFNAHRLVEDAIPDNCLSLTRLWLSDRLPKNSESRLLGIVLRALKNRAELKFLLAYADAAHRHVGVIYQASNWLYTGISEAMPLFDIGDGNPRHSRSLAHAYGTHSVKHFKRHGVDVKVVPQAGKHRYVYFLDPGWKHRLLCKVLPYPKKEAVNGNH